MIGVTVDHGLQEGRPSTPSAWSRRWPSWAPTRPPRPGSRCEGGGRGPEAAAREARYAVLDQLVAALRCRSGCCSATPSTTRPRPCCSAWPAAPAAGRWPACAARFDHYRRPLLDVTRTDTVTACQVEGIEYWNDPHNIDPTFTRVRVRRKVLPVLEDELGPGVAGALARTADQLRADMELLDQLAQAAYDELRDAGRAGGQGARRPAARDPPPGAPAGRAGGRRARLRAVPRARPGPGPAAARRGGVRRRGPAARPRDGVPVLGRGGPSLRFRPTAVQG